MLLPVANKVSNVHESAFKIRPDRPPIACAGRNHNPQPSVGVGRNNTFVARLGVVIPGNSNHIFWKNRQQLGIFDRNIAPEHELLVIRLHDTEDLLEVFRINATQALLGSERLRLAKAEFKSLVRADVKKWARK